jgi:penicillin-insensitive murein endopeptidase
MKFETRLGIEFATIALAASLSGCLPWIGIGPDSNGAVGTTSKGLLSGGGHLPAEGEHFRFYHSWDRRYGSLALIGMIERAAAQVAEEHAGSVLSVGDMSAKNGGFISGHSSHRSGRDVDFAFFRSEINGRRADRSPAMIRFDRFGAGVKDGKAYLFDTERNWCLVEALITDPKAQVQWILVSDGLKALILEWALDNDRAIEIVRRAVNVLHQPSDSAAHDDHFHVRIYCDPADAYCQDTGPRWPWISPAIKSPLKFTDEELVRLALED